jgi:hypothetical protein
VLSDLTLEELLLVRLEQVKLKQQKIYQRLLPNSVLFLIAKSLWITNLLQNSLKGYLVLEHGVVLMNLIELT